MNQNFSDRYTHEIGRWFRQRPRPADDRVVDEPAPTPPEGSAEPAPRGAAERVRIVTIALLAAILPAAEPAFSAKPTASVDKAGLRIAFAVTMPTDAEVAILDAGGRVVRHLAAGLLGPKSPPPFNQGLAQTLSWDGTDDAGRPVRAANVRVRLGLRAGAYASCLLDAKEQRQEPPRIPPLDVKGLQGILTYNVLYNNNFAKAVMLCGDPETGTPYLRDAAFWHGWGTWDFTTRMRTPLPEFASVVGDLQFGADGAIYTFHWNQIRKWDRAWKPLPFAGTKAPAIILPQRYPSHDPGQYDAAARAFGDEVGPVSRCLGLDGRFYQFIDLPDTAAARLRIWRADGSLEKEGVIPFAAMRHASNLRVDARGRLYLAVNGLPAGWQPGERDLPLKQCAAFRGTLLRIVPGEWLDKPRPPATAADAGLVLTGFSSATWTPAKNGPGLMPGANWGAVRLQPAEYRLPKVDLAIPGVSWMSPTPECTCGHLAFDLDRYGRIYLPDPALRRVRVLDENGNDLFELAERSGSQEILWPMRLFAHEDGLVFWDGLARTINRQTFAYAASETCAVGGG